MQRNIRLSFAMSALAGVFFALAAAPMGLRPRARTARRAKVTNNPGLFSPPRSASGFASDCALGVSERPG
jgi:hypothetical protein